MLFLPSATKLRQSYVFTGVCHSVNREGVVPVTPPPDLEQTPPWDQVHPPGTRYTPQDQVHSLGPGTPPGTRYTPPDQVQPPPRPGTPPGIRYTPGTRYTPRDQVNPPDQVHPPDQVFPWDQGHPQTRYTPPGPGTPLDQVQPSRPGTTPMDQVHPLGPGKPPGPGTLPQTRYTPRDQVPPPDAEHAGRYGQHAGGTHPTGMKSCFLIYSHHQVFVFTHVVLFFSNGQQCTSQSCPLYRGWRYT